MTYRVYFNRCEDFPQVWSVDCGTVATEINVIDFRVEPGCDVRGGCDWTVADRVREPRCWAAVTARSLTVEDGVAVFGA